MLSNLTNLAEALPGVKTLLIISAYVAPFIFLPAAFKATSGAAGRIFGAVNDRSKGIFDRNKNFRANSQKSAKEALRTGNRFEGGKQGNLRGSLNSRLQRTSVTGAAGFSMNRSTRAARKDAVISRMTTENSKKLFENEAMAGINGDEDQIQAGAYVGSDKKAGSDKSIREYLENLAHENSKSHVGTNGVKGDDADPSKANEAAASRQEYMDKTRSVREQKVAAVREAVREVSSEDYAAWSAVATAGTGTGYKGGQGEMMAAINKAAGGDRNKAARLLVQARGQAERANRPDLAGSGFGAGKII